MIKKVKVKMKKDKAEKTQAWQNSGSSYSEETGELSFDLNQKTGTDWALIHDDKTALAVIEGSEKGFTETIHKIEEFETEQECLDQIKKLGLIYNPPENLIEAK